MKKLFVLLLICLCGCSTLEKTTVCKLDSETLKITNTLVSKNDRLLNQTNVNEMDYSQFGFTEETMKLTAENYKAVYKNIGVQYTYSIEENILKETVKVDYESTDFEKLASAGLIDITATNAKIVSLEKTLESYKQQGFTCE